MINKNDVIAALEKNIYGLVSLITINGITIAEIQYIDVKEDADNKDMINLVVYSASPECVNINYKAVKYIREFDDILELTIV